MKQIDSKIERWKGHVLLHDPIPLVKLATFEEALTEALLLDPKLGKAKSHVAIIPALIDCVAEWHIEGFPEKPTVETFPGIGTGISKSDIASLINLIANSIMTMFKGGDPNA